MPKLLAALFLILLASGCGKDPNLQLDKLSDEFVNTTLAFSPAAATGAGLHKYKNQNLDDLLDDLSPASLDKQRQFYRDFQNRLSKLSPDKLTPEGRTDLTLLQDQVAASLLDLDEFHSSQHNPVMYVETLGNALFNCYVLEYA